MARRLRAGEYALGIDGLALLRLASADEASGADDVVSEMSDLLERLDEPELSKDSRGDPVNVVDGYERGPRCRPDRPLPVVRSPWRASPS